MFMHKILFSAFLTLLIMSNVFIIPDCIANESFENKGYYSYRNKDYNSAIVYFNKALSINPLSEHLYVYRGNSWAEDKKYQYALQDYNKAIEINPYFYQAYYARGYLWSEIGNSSNAISDYTKAIDINKRYVSAYINRADLLKKTGQTSKALDDYTSGLKVTPDDPKLLIARGDIFLIFKQYDNAISDYSESIKIDSKNMRAFVARADTWYVINNYENAIKDYENAINIQPLNYESYNNLAWILSTCPDDKYRDGTRAILMANKALQIVLNSDNKDLLPIAYSTLAAAYAENNIFKNAIEYQSKAIQHAKNTGKGNINKYEAHMQLYIEKKPLRFHGETAR